MLHDVPGGGKKRPELCVTITARILYGEKFRFCAFVSYNLFINFSDIINDLTECRLIT